jgi:long-chain acyl-CoA synthetase
MAILTLCDVLREAVTKRPRPDAFREKRRGLWEDVSSGTFLDDVTAIGEGLVSLGLARGDRVAILSENRYHWAVADMAAVTRGAIVVPLYPTLPANQVAAILDDSGAKWVFVSTREQTDKILDVGAGLKNIGSIFTFDDVVSANPAILSYEELLRRGRGRFESMGKDALGAIRGVEPDDLATIIYTSGTTGEPKGVMLSHHNIVSNVLASLAVFPIDTRDRCLSFLPLSHVFERVAGYYVMFFAGASIAYAEDVKTVAEDSLSARPTIIIGVPRFFEKFHGRVLEAIQAAPPVRRGLFNWAKAVGLEVARRRSEDRRLTPGLALQRFLAAALVYRRLRERIGGRIRFFVSGGAPLSAEVNLFFHGVGLPIYEGYGLTETSPVISANAPGRNRIGSVGRPVPGVDLEIADDGEILVRGPNVSRGYFRKPDVTRASMKEGWFCTGDIGRVDDDGYLYITDRKKDLIVTAGGKNVAPAPIEERLKRSRYVSEAILLGDRRKFVCAVIAPDFEALEEHARTLGIGFHDRRDLVRSDAIRTLFEEEVAIANKGLANFETIKKFIIMPGGLSVEDGTLTPTMKVKRRMIEERLRDEIEAVYAE